MVYLSMLSEYAKYSKILKTMEKGDTLLLLYPEGKDQISLSVVNTIKESKGKVIFDEIRALKSLNEEVAVAYRLGGLLAKYNSIKVVSESKILLELLGSQAPSSTRKVPSVPKITKEPENTEKSASSSKKTPTKRQPRAPKTVSQAESKIIVTPLPDEGRITNTEPLPEEIKPRKTSKTAKSDNLTVFFIYL